MSRASDALRACQDTINQACNDGFTQGLQEGLHAFLDRPVFVTTAQELNLGGGTFSNGVLVVMLNQREGIRVDGSGAKLFAAARPPLWIMNVTNSVKEITVDVVGGNGLLFGPGTEPDWDMKNKVLRSVPVKGATESK